MDYKNLLKNIADILDDALWDGEPADVHVHGEIVQLVHVLDLPSELDAESQMAERMKINFKEMLDGANAEDT